MRHSKWVTVLAAGSLLAACDQQQDFSKQDIGTAVGAVGGGIVGYQFGGGAGQALATVGGALLGGALGNIVGKSLDDKDRTSYDLASQKAMDTGYTQTWSNPNSGHHGTIIPGRRFVNDAGETCRGYRQTIYVKGEKHESSGTACRGADGVWLASE